MPSTDGIYGNPAAWESVMTEWLQEVVFWIDQASILIMAMIFAGMAGASVFMALVMFGVFQ